MENKTIALKKLVAQLKEITDKIGALQVEMEVEDLAGELPYVVCELDEEKNTKVDVLAPLGEQTVSSGAFIIIGFLACRFLSRSSA